MKNNVFLFHGEEKFMIYQELSKWKKSFSTKYGSENIFEYKSDDIDIGNITNTIFSGGLFVSRKLVIIWGLPKDTDSENKILESKYKVAETKLIEKFEQVPSDIVVVFVSFTPDKRTAGFKFFSTNCTVKQFDKISDKEKKIIIKNILGDNIDDSSIDYLIGLVGSDLFSLNNETNKLKYYSQANNIKINKEIIDNVVYSIEQINTFDILDKIFFEKKETINLITKIQKQSFDPLQFLGMLYWGIRNVIFLIDLYKKGETSTKEVASKLGLHPFVVTKNFKIIKQLIEKENSIKNLFKQLIEVDTNLKNGKVPVEFFWFEIKNLILKFD